MAWRHQMESTLVQIMACCPLGAKLNQCWFNVKWDISIKFQWIVWYKTKVGSQTMVSICALPKLVANIHGLPKLVAPYSDLIMNVMASQITGISIVCSTVCSDTDQRIYQSSVSRTFVRWIHWWPVDFPHKGPVMCKMFPFDDDIMQH